VRRTRRRGTGPEGGDPAEEDVEDDACAPHVRLRPVVLAKHLRGHVGTGCPLIREPPPAREKKKTGVPAKEIGKFCSRSMPRTALQYSRAQHSTLQCGTVLVPSMNSTVLTERGGVAYLGGT